MIRRFIRYLKLVIEARRKRVVSALVYPAVLVGALDRDDRRDGDLRHAAVRRSSTTSSTSSCRCSRASSLGVSLVPARQRGRASSVGIVGVAIVALRRWAARRRGGWRSTAPSSGSRSSGRCSTASRSRSSAARSRPCSPAACRWCPRSRSRPARWATPTCARKLEPAVAAGARGQALPRGARQERRRHRPRDRHGQGRRGDRLARRHAHRASPTSSTRRSRPGCSASSRCVEPLMLVVMGVHRRDAPDLDLPADVLGHGQSIR